ncbi:MULTISPECIES: hypothetical protein [Halorussus]|uniref:hypothetical protein n=1 Tax=Halorussus TaxID=1070314 RepID=UPI0020A17D23|nr:hypothetical protein [Halorussus vallis]USZ76867.1 hypothetical protein NGM07_05940 [Halorussus vallis]
MPYELSDSLAEDPSPVARLLSVVRTPYAGALGILTVLAVVALPHPLPDYPTAAYAAVGVAEGVGLAVAAENLVFRPTRRFDLRRAVRKTAAVAAATAAFVGAMVALGVELGIRDWTLLGGFAVSVPAALAGIDYLKARVRRNLRVRESST